MYCRSKLFGVLKNRGFLQALTCNESRFEEYLNKKPLTCYIGFDPTADSLHIGNLLQLMCLRHFKDHGHQTIALVGGATGLIGDPSGRSTERPLLLKSQIESNALGIESCIRRVLHSNNESTNEGPSPLVLNNYDWLRNVGLLDFLRDYGKLFKVQQMLNKNSVKSRMVKEDSSPNDEGISFTEFSYQLLQAYDFYHLYREHDCSLQIGGSDQWGNITGGIQLIHRLINPQIDISSDNDENITNSNGEHLAYGMTLPLITTSDGKKLGKSSSAPGAGIWLDPKRSKPYDLYQYIINLTDEDAIKFLPLFTFISLEEIQSIKEQHGKEPHLRGAQKRLAYEITSLLHGEEEANKAKSITASFFEGNCESLSLNALPSETPRLELSRDDVISQKLITVLGKTSLFKSNKEIKRTISEGGLYLNNNVVDDINKTIEQNDILDSDSKEFILLRRGKKKYFIITVE